MMLCVKTVSYNFCFNDALIGPNIRRKGLRQGDPLSPYLFLVCVEGLSNALDLSSASGEIHGCRIAPTAPSMSHILFADDSFLFFQGTTEEDGNVKRVLEDYERHLGQAVNLMKSEVYFSANIRRDKQVEICGILGVYNEITETKYLGLPSFVGRSKRKVFGYLKEEAIRNRLISKGMRVPITYPMCLSDIEHLAYLLFDCPFAAACWEHVNMSFNWQEIEFAPDWLLEKITTLNSKDLSKV
ncbi:uncharacterized protein LOC141714501 [Apium graveolens]|uniref:uncharacterized protein LOC141714501 n=1 Tax=Apium graveolens TaxID=4045 RepID=UPI003D7A2D45